MYLNNAIRKHGALNFKVEVLEYCPLDEANDKEIELIRTNMSLFPNGYNLTIGGKKGPTTIEQRVKLMEKSQDQFITKKIERFAKVYVDPSKIDTYIHENKHERYGGVYYTVRVDNVKSIFVAQHLPKESLREQALNFLKTLIKKQQDHAT